jgi:hypothetical protein
MENNYSGKQPVLADPAGFDFRPRAGSALIDAGKHIPGITDGYQREAPDIGAYEFDGQRWLPGCINALWISAPRKCADGALAIRIALRMPPTEAVSLAVASGDPKANLASGETLTFTEANWMHAQTITLSGYRGALTLRFRDKHLGSAHISDAGAIDSQLGQVVAFDRPMLATEPAEFAPYSE